MSPPDGANFCSQCGAAVSPDDAFCSNCGSSVGYGASAGGGSFRRRIEDLTVEGWEVKHDYGDRVVMVDRGIGSVGVHVLLFAVTAGLGNLLYAWYSYTVGADRIELRADGTERYVDADREEGGEDGSMGLRHAAASFFSALIGLSILSGVSSLPAFFVAMTFLAVALWVLPPVRERLDDREAVTKFGRARSTDEEVVRAPDVPCTACSRPVDTGVKRTFHETLYVAGLPVSRDEQGENYYCRECARGDPFTGADAAGEDREREPEPEF